MTKGTILNVRVEGEEGHLGAGAGATKEIFVKAGPRLTEPVLAEAKATGDKIDKLLKDLGV